MVAQRNKAPSPRSSDLLVYPPGGLPSNSQNLFHRSISANSLRAPQGSDVNLPQSALQARHDRSASLMRRGIVSSYGEFSSHSKDRESLDAPATHILGSAGSPTPSTSRQPSSSPSSPSSPSTSSNVPPNTAQRNLFRTTPQQQQPPKPNKPARPARTSDTPGRRTNNYLTKKQI